MRVSDSVSLGIVAGYLDASSDTAEYAESISSGIKSVTEDAAAVAISERTLASISSTMTARQNVENSISMLQTANSWTETISSSLSRMKALAVQANDGTLSESDRINAKVEFKALQREVTRISSKYTAAAEFNGLMLLQGEDVEVQTGSDQGEEMDIGTPDLSDTNNEKIGDVVTYDESGTQTKTPVKWNDIIDSVNGLEIDDEDAVGKLDVAMDFVSNAMVSNSAQLTRLETQRDELIAQENSLMESESSISDTDVAGAVMNMIKSQVQTQASAAILTQGNELAPLALLSLIRGK